ncbi:hypothetical protein D5086_020325 [Populus alba]|uniref:Uncharacterized protein n=1 Tax=Populus alba TaxID=43335 RepID=A0ACC4BKE5_POPAL
MRNEEVWIAPSYQATFAKESIKALLVDVCIIQEEKPPLYPGYYPALLPLPPPIPLQLALTPPLPQNHSFISKTQLQKPLCKLNNPSPPPPSPSPHTSSDTKSPAVTTSPAFEGLQQQKNRPLKGDGGRKVMSANTQSLVVARRPDSGGVEGSVITLLANHFPVQFDSSQRIFHYNVEISPNPSREVARMIKQKLVKENSAVLSGALPAYDGRKSLYSPVEFQKDRLEFYVSLPIPTSKSSLPFGEFNFLQEKHQQLKLFRINIKLVSKLDGKELSRYLSKEGDDWIPLPQDYLHALDVVLRESPMERCIPVGRSLYSSSMGGTKEIGGGAVALRGFFQSLRPTQQGLALNVDFSVTAFHESIGIIPYLQKRLEFLRDLPQRKKRSLVGEERKEVEKALKNIRIFVCHRETVQRYRVFGLTEEATENLWFSDRDGKNLRLLSYFKDHYNYDIQFRNLPCLQISRSKPCYLPMELCMICEGQKFLGKLSDDQTARILKMGCQRPKERKAIIDGVMRGTVGPTSGSQGREFKLQISREMTRLSGRILQPPKLRLGDGGHVRDLIPSRHDCQWNLLDSHVFEGTRIQRWALISFGGTLDQKSSIPKFINQLSQRCEQLGIFLNKNTMIKPQFEPTQVLNNVSLLESKLKKIHSAASNNLQLLICVMEKKHKGPPITFAVVQKRHHTRLFPNETDPSSTQNQFSDENIPPGTVVDTVITHPREFDFYLCSHWGVKGTSRPTHYHVLWDENQFTSDELQKLVYNLCYTFVRCTKPVSLVPPAYYAHLAAYRGRLYLERSECMASMRNASTISRAAPPKAAPLPKLSENLKKLMFYC